MTTEKEVPQTMDEINKQYDGEWLMVRVLKSDRYGLQEAAVLAHDSDKEKIAAMLPRAQDAQPRPSLAFFRAHAPK
ncbi:MAG: hypothetical protein AB7P33_00975 [Dehalococcoidia bacterium]